MVVEGIEDSTHVAPRHSEDQVDSGLFEHPHDCFARRDFFVKQRPGRRPSKLRCGRHKALRARFVSPTLGDCRFSLYWVLSGKRPGFFTYSSLGGTGFQPVSLTGWKPAPLKSNKQIGCVPLLS